MRLRLRNWKNSSSARDSRCCDYPGLAGNDARTAGLKGLTIFDKHLAFPHNGTMGQTLFIGSDHAGFALKSYLIEQLSSEYEVIDCGPSTLDSHDDYPDYARIVCERVLAHDARGILICDTGIGVSIAANRHDGIRAALVVTPFMAERSRLHNDANVICLGQELVSREENTALIRQWLITDFSAQERHIRRLQKIDCLGYNEKEQNGGMDEEERPLYL